MKKRYLSYMLSAGLLIIPVNVCADDLKNTYDMDGIVITANTYEITDYCSQDGQYDRAITFNFTIKNDTDSPYGYSKSWGGKTLENEPLQAYMDLMDTTTTFVQPGEEITDVATLLVPSGLEIQDDIIVTYDFLDYNDEYWEDFGKAIFGQMTQEEWESKYADVEELIFQITAAAETTDPSEFSYAHSGHIYKYAGNRVRDNEVLIYFEYTNESGETAYPDTALTITAFQNGIELDGTLPGYEDITEEEEIALEEVASGKTVDIALTYILQDESDVSIKINPRQSTNITDIGKYTFSLNK